MRSRWLVVASWFAIISASCAESTQFGDPAGEQGDVVEEEAAATPVPELSQTEYEVTIDPETGALSKKYVMKGVRWLQYYPAYNEMTGEHSFIGMWEAGQAPSFLYTYNRAGALKGNPEIPFPNSLITMQYSRSTGVLYGITVQGGKFSFVTIDRNTGLHTLIRELPDLDVSGDIAIDEANQRMFVRGVDRLAGVAVLRTVDLASGSVIYQAPMPAGSLSYDNATHTLYGLRWRTIPNTYESMFTICKVDPETGTLWNINDLPGVSGIAMDRSTFNEKDHEFMFIGIDKVPQAYLYSVDAMTGSLRKAPISRGGHLGQDNLIFIRYDNKRNKLYGMLWQAMAPPPPVIGIAPQSRKL